MTTQAEKRAALRDRQHARDERVRARLADARIQQADDDLAILREKTRRAEQRLDKAVFTRIASAKGLDVDTLPAESLTRLADAHHIAIFRGVACARGHAVDDPDQTTSAE